MVRTIISLDPKEKAWLDRQARRAGVSMTELVRLAIRHMREQDQAEFHELLERTRGIWRKGDGLSYQRRLREQWP